jgi:hypothetical protein
MKDEKKSDKPFVGTPDHQALARAGIMVITPTATKAEVEGLLGSQEFSDAITAYCGA